MFSRSSGRHYVFFSITRGGFKGKIFGVTANEGTAWSFTDNPCLFWWCMGGAEDDRTWLFGANK